MQGFFLFDELQFESLQFRLFPQYSGIDANFAVGFRLLLFAEFLVLHIESFQRCFGQFNGFDFVFFFDLVVALGFFRLAFQCFQLIVDLEQKIFDACQVLLGGIQLQLCLFLSRFVNGDACCLFQHAPTGIVFVLDDVVHHSQFHDRVAVGAHARIQEQVDDVLQPALYIVEAVFALPAFVKAAGDGHGTEFRWQQVFGVLERQADFRHSARVPGLGTVEHQAIQILASKVADFMFADHPADGIHDIAFAAAVGTDNARNSFVKIDDSLIRKTLEPLDL